MKVSLKWLNKYVDLSDVSAEQIAEALPMLGLVVESVETTGLKPDKLNDVALTTACSSAMPTSIVRFL